MRFKIYKEQRLLVDVLEGRTELADLKAIFSREAASEDFFHVKRVLSNVRKADFQFSPAELKSYIELVFNTNPDPDVRWAILTSSPTQVAYSLLMKKEEYFNKIVGVFSTVEACCDFLDVTFSEEQFAEAGYEEV